MPDRHQTHSETEEAAGHEPGKERILLVDDDDTVRRMTKELLEMMGYDVLEAANGNEALRLCESRETLINLVLTDVMMPSMTGTELAERLKALRPDLRLMYMSGFTGDALSEWALAQSDIPFLQKPFTPEDLAETVKQALVK